MILLFLMSLETANVYAQVAIGANTVPHPGAVLDLKSTTQGLLLPRVALSSVSVFGLAGDAAQAVGMTVYNTNIDMISGRGVGIYTWNGSAWANVSGGSGGIGQPGVLDTIQGSKATYRIWCFPESTGLGCWMVDNSKEGSPSATSYMSGNVGIAGYYYTWGNAAGACPAGWALPNLAQWKNLMDYLNGTSSSLEDKFWWSVAGALAGYWTGTAWAGMGVQGKWWVPGTTNYSINSNAGIMDGPYGTGATYASVRCYRP